MDFLYNFLDGALGQAFRTYFLLPIGLLLLVKGADWLVGGASAIAKKFNISDIMIGLTVVSFGTSAPELIVSLKAAFSNSSEIVFGNVVGSNIFNIGLILGASGLIYPLVVQRNTGLIELPFSFFIAVLTLLLANDLFLGDGSSLFLGRLDGLVILVFFAGFLYYVFKNAKAEPSDEEIVQPMSTGTATLFLILGFLCLVLGANLLVDNSKIIAQNYGMSETVIGLTIVGIGTSLPELATSVMAAYRKNSDIAIGNVVGSNIFNILFILGSSCAIYPIKHDAANNIHLYVLFGFTALLFAFLFMGTKSEKRGVFTLDRWQSFVLLVLSMVYLYWLIATAAPAPSPSNAPANTTVTTPSTGQ